MRKFKTMALALSMTALLSTGMVFAAEYSSPIEVLSNLTGSSVEEIYEQRGNKENCYRGNRACKKIFFRL